MYIPVSPNPYSDSSEEEAFCKIFSPNINQDEAIEDIAQDILYFNQVESKENIKNPMIFEDFDQCYKKFKGKEDPNEIQGANYENPSFFISSCKERIFSSFEDENIVKVINPEDNIIKFEQNKFLGDEKNDKEKYNNDDNIEIKDIEKLGKNKFVIELEEDESKSDKRENKINLNNNNKNLKNFGKQKSIKNKKKKVD